MPPPWPNRDWDDASLLEIVFEVITISVDRLPSAVYVAARMPPPLPSAVLPVIVFPWTFTVESPPTGQFVAPNSYCPAAIKRPPPSLTVELPVMSLFDISVTVFP